MEMKRLSLNSDGAFRTIIQSLIPHIRNSTSTEKLKQTFFSIFFSFTCRKICSIFWIFSQKIVFDEVLNLHPVKLWSHQSLRQRYALRSSAVRPTMTIGGATNVRIPKNTANPATMIPKRRSKCMSVILIIFADRTRKITEMLKN